MSLAETLAPIWAELSSIKKRLPSVSPATVTSVGPVRIQVDGQAAPVAASPDSLVPVGPGDRVRVLRYGTTHLILGQVYTGQWESLPVTVGNGWADESGRYIHVRRVGGMVEFRCELRRADAASGASFTSLPAKYRPARQVWEAAMNTAGNPILATVEAGGLARMNWGSTDPGTSLIRWHTTWGI